MKQKYYGLNLMTAGICNLNCSFCFLHNKNYNSVHEQDKNIILAWETGEYLANIKKVFLKNNYDPQFLSTISLWGGETLLHIDKITPNLKNICTFFPNIEKWIISTNFMINIDNFLNFLFTLDQYSNHGTQVGLQLSIDGPPGVFIEKGHNGDWNKYLENITKLMKLQLTNLYININFNAVLSKDIFLNELNTIEKIKYYVNYMHAFIQDINQKYQNKHINFSQEYVFPKCDTSADLNLEERQQLLSIYLLFENIQIKTKNHFYDGLFGDNYLNYPIVSNNLECGALKTMITILPNGDEVRCSGSYMANSDLYKTELIKENNNKDLFTFLIEEATSFNHLSNSNKLDFEWNIINGVKNTTNTYLYFILKMCEELLDANQILEKYNNKELLIKQIEMLMMAFHCDKNNVAATGIPYLPDINLLRRYFNGLADFIYNTEKQEKMEEFCINE